MSIFNHILLSPGYAPGTITVNVTRMEREFNACQTHRNMYASIFNRLRAIARYWSEIATFSYPALHLTPPYGVATRTIAVNVTRIEREFSDCQTPRSMYPSIFNRFPVIQAVSLKVRHFSTFFFTFCLPCVRLWDNRGKCHTVGKRIQCWSNASQHVPIYLQQFTSYSEILVGN